MSVRVDGHTLRGNFWMLVCYTYKFFGPCAVVWGECSVSDDKRRVFNVYDSYTPKHCRRKGFRTAINNHLFNEADIDVIISTSGSKEGGKEFMETSGYVIERMTGKWMLTKSKHRKIQKMRKEKKDGKEKK